MRRILHTLRVRYTLDMIYTYSGNILIAVWSFAARLAINTTSAYRNMTLMCTNADLTIDLASRQIRTSACGTCMGPE